MQAPALTRAALSRQAVQAKAARAAAPAAPVDSKQQHQALLTPSDNSKTHQNALEPPATDHGPHQSESHPAARGAGRAPRRRGHADEPAAHGPGGASIGSGPFGPSRFNHLRRPATPPPEWHIDGEGTPPPVRYGRPRRAKRARRRRRRRPCRLGDSGHLVLPDDRVWPPPDSFREKSQTGGRRKAPGGQVRREVDRPQQRRRPAARRAGS